MATDLLFLFLLIVLNGVFAMSEIAIVGSRRARLLQMAEAGSAGARHAMGLAAEPTRFLSTVQIGITSIGILSGAIGEEVIAGRLRGYIEQVPALTPYAGTLSLVLMVVLLTYVSLIVGELAPKRFALTSPEKIASAIAQPMEALAAIGRPIVKVLSVSTDGVLRLLGIGPSATPAVSVDEVRLLLEQGAREGVLENTEHELMTNVLTLDDRHAGSVLTPRSEIVFLDTRDPPDATREKLRRDPHQAFPVCDGGIDHIVGIVRTTRVLEQVVEDGQIDLKAIAEPPLYVPETISLMKLLEQFRRTRLPMALIVDEHGDVEGLVSLTDVVGAIVGELPLPGDVDPEIVRRHDGSWLMDGAADLESVVAAIGVSGLAEAERQHFHTLGGLAMAALGRVPRIGDVFDRGGFRFEIVDMDRNRVDRVLVSQIESAERR